jgi:hypothetical protein
LALQSHVAYVCLANAIVKSHYHVIEDSEFIAGRLEYKDSYTKLPGTGTSEHIIREILINISNVILPLPNKRATVAELIKIYYENSEKINAKLQFIDESDYTEMETIAREAYIYVSDYNYNEPRNVIKRDTLFELYARGIAKPESPFSHNLMRNAVFHARMWLVKFLISKGVQTKNSPTFRNYPGWLLGGDSLIHMLLSELSYEDRITFINIMTKFPRLLKSPKFVNVFLDTMTNDRRKIYDYLYENNYL